MKFSCDSCGAQYLIADEKIGPKGVKVRCKKCTHVIILRPPGWKPTPKKVASIPPPPPPPETPLVPPVSSDMGVSQEFAALGFEDRPARRPATLSVGLDVAAVPEPRPETSPFQSQTQQRSGGSLDEVMTPPSAAAKANGNGVHHPEIESSVGLGSSVPASEGDDDEEVATRVDALAALAQSEQSTPKKDPLTAVEDLSALAALEREHSLREQAEREASDFAVDTDPAKVAQTFPAFGEVQTETPSDDHASDPTPPPVAAFEPPTAVEAKAPIEEPPAATEPPEDTPGFDDGDDPFADMKSSLDEELGAQLGGLGEPAPEGDNGFEANPKTEVSSRPEVVAAREAETMEQPRPAEAIAATPKVEDPAAQTEISSEEGGLEGDIASELGSAFDQMFGEGGNELEELAAELGAKPEAPSEEENRKETRIFDTEAIGQVEAEQRRAEDDVDPVAAEWFVAIDDEQVGPLDPLQVLEHWEAGRLKPDSLCWKQGMGDWIPMAEVAEFEDLPQQEEAEAPEAPAPLGPPTLAGHRETEIAAPVAQEASEPAWRPSAASALASLAAEELAAPVPEPSMPPAAAPISGTLSAIPPASDALEKLLGGEAEPSATARFGAAEQSESLVRPLPRRADTVSSLPLRDPTQQKSSPNWVLPATILAAILLLGLFVLGGIMLLKDDPKPADEVATTKAAPPATPPVAPPAAVAAPTGAPAVAAATGPSGASGAAELAALAAGAAPSGPSGAAEGKAVEAAPPPPPPPKKAKRTPKKRKPRTTRRRSPPPPPKAPPPRLEVSNDPDDLLNPRGSRPRRRVESAPSVPRQLDESDILGVLRKNRNDVRRCLEKQAASDPRLEGTMTVDLVVLKSGRPRRVSVQPSKFKKAAVGKCVVSSVKRWRFPKFSGPSMPVDFPVRVRAR